MLVATSRFAMGRQPAVTSGIYYVRKRRVRRTVGIIVGKNGGVMDAPLTGQDKLTNISFEPFYRVILQYTLWNDNKLIAEKIVKAIPGIGKDNADRSARIAKAYGSSILLTTTRDMAESYVQRLGTFGLKGNIEEA